MRNVKRNVKRTRWSRWALALLVTGVLPSCKGCDDGNPAPMAVAVSVSPTSGSLGTEFRVSWRVTTDDAPRQVRVLVDNNEVFASPEAAGSVAVVPTVVGSHEALAYADRDSDSQVSQKVSFAVVLACQVDFSWDPVPPRAGQTWFQFAPHLSGCGDNPGVRWDFGDGASSDEASPLHGFTPAQTYRVTLTARGVTVAHDVLAAPASYQLGDLAVWNAELDFRNHNSIKVGERFKAQPYTNCPTWFLKKEGAAATCAQGPLNGAPLLVPPGDACYPDGAGTWTYIGICGQDGSKTAKATLVVTP
jgi:hypothetical protein